MLTLDNLDGLKLVRDENIANLPQALAEVEHAVTQGSQGWGVTDEHAVLLRVAGELRNALQVATTTDGLQVVLDATKAALKGKQLELGRVKAKAKITTQQVVDLGEALIATQARHERMLDVSNAQSEEIANVRQVSKNRAAIIDVKDDKIRELTEELDSAQSALAGMPVSASDPGGPQL